MSTRWHPKTCRVCGVASTETEPISAKGYCLAHGIGRMHENNAQLMAGSGPFYDRWARRTFMAARQRVLGQLESAS